MQRLVGMRPAAATAAPVMAAVAMPAAAAAPAAAEVAAAATAVAMATAAANKYYGCTKSDTIECI